MNHKRPPVPAIVILVLIISLSAYFFYTQSMEDKNGALTASGFIEAVQVNVAPELAGRVTDVLVSEGQAVRKGDPLLRLDPSLLAAQRAVAAAQVDTAKAALASAQTQWEFALQAALAAQGSQQAKDWRLPRRDEFDQPTWYFSPYEQLTAAQTVLDDAQLSYDAAYSGLQNVLSDLNNADFLAAEKRLAEARAAFLVAESVRTAADSAADGSALRNAANESYGEALDQLTAVQDEYEALLDTQSAEAVAKARANLILALQRLDTAQARVSSLQSGATSPAVVAAAKARDQARTALAQAEANLALLDTQIAKLTIYAPMDGIILTRNVEVGEFVQPGATSFIIGRLSDLTITVFVPEDRFGQLKIGQSAAVSVDSFPGVTFTATVIQIADKAEFTPRNVQTVEGRSSTVFAIKLSISNTDGKLKIGMPADVVFK